MNTLLTLSLLALPAAGPAPDFNREVRPILADKCFHCHGPDAKTRKGGLRLDTAKGAARVLRGKTPADTDLVHRVATADADLKMPPADANFTKPLTPKEVATLTAWVASGGKYSGHWAFERPVKAPLPPAATPAWAAPVDRFVRERLAREGLTPGAEAENLTLLRRVTLDLTGLPPTPAEADAFLADTSPGAYERVVDRLLASPRYGERLTLAWLDLARYGDSSVYHADGPRDMWAWRDWVIKAFNDNLPFDRFTVEQVAGDLLPGATAAQKIASGFNRNHATTDEGGVIPEEFRVDYVVDRVKTVSSTWLGLSLECAQCHDHKYDPVTQKEYYQFYAYFNNTRDAGMQTRNGNSAPLVEVDDPDAPLKALAAQKARDAARAQVTAAREKALKSKAYADWLAKQTPPAGAPAPPPLLLHLPGDAPGPAGTVTGYPGLVGLPVVGKLTAAKRPGAGAALKVAGNAVLAFPDGPELERTTPFTFSVWAKLPADGGGYLLTRMDESKDYRGFDLGFDARKPGLHLVHRWPDNGLKVYARQPLTPDVWHHVVIRHDGSGKAAGVAIWVDGVKQDQDALNDTLTGTALTAEPLRLGSRSDAGMFKGEFDALTLFKGAVPDAEVKAAGLDPVARLLAVPADKRLPEQSILLAERFQRETDPGYRTRLEASARKLDGGRKGKGPAGSVMVMEDLPPAQMRATYVLSRGQYDQPLKDQPVKPGVPAALPPLPTDAPANRLGLARWLVAPEHPLTSRVAVNRLWQIFFGEGLVRTTEDFGIQGEVPSHQELLDWLAVDFVENRWDVKRLVRHLVTSATYKQDSRISPALREKDPENRLLARGPRFRLQGEFIRDGALAVSGLLVEQTGGPSVKPYQPAGVWEEVALDTNLSRYVQDRGEKLYRRSMYTYWKRSSPHPALMTFDAPSREKCTGNRPRTNTPLQALVTLNDPQFVEAARVLAGRVLQQAGPTPEARARQAVRLVLARPATDREVAVLTRLAAIQTARFQADPKKAEALLGVGEWPRDMALTPADHAAWAVVASTLLNLDEFLSRN